MKKEELAAKLEKTIKEFVDGESDFILNLDEWKLQIRIKGPKWKGVVDKPLATFVLDLDRKLTAELAKHGVEVPKTDHGIVSLRVDEGSTLAFLEGVPETIEQIRQLPPEKQMLVFISILFAAGVWGAKDIVKSIMDRKKEAKSEEEETKREEIRSRERVETIMALTGKETVRELEAPLRGLVSRLGNDDTIELPTQDKPTAKKQVKNQFEKATRSKPKNYYIDGAYTVEGISTKNPKNWRISLNYGPVTFAASLQLSELDVQELLKDFQEAHEKNRKIGPYLHVTSEINSRGVQKASVVGIGQPRKNAISLSDALKSEGYDFSAN